jgi:hypothetical protein
MSAAMKFQLNPQSRILRFSCFLLLARFIFPLAAQTDNADPKDATGWFQRASDQMNLRLPGSAPFHMKVAFTALPGLELLDKNKKPQIITGDGTYEETWLAPHHWRREVTMGYYHAVEVESEQGRKMQSSSSDPDDTPSRVPRDHEPGRVLMLLDALLYPIRRDRLSADLDETHLRWTIEHKTAGNISYVLISAQVDADNGIYLSYIFLPNGLLVQSNYIGLTTSFQDEAAFAGHEIPKQLTIEAGGRKLLTASITVQAADQVDPALFELPGPPADPGVTLRPLHYFEVKQSFDISDCSTSDIMSLFPLEVRLVADRHGAMRELELLDARKLQETAASAGVAALLDCYRNKKVQPATIDKSPAELAMSWYFKPRFNHK